jgi:hypothetical protein
MDPEGILSAGLRSLLLFENVAPPTGLMDYANPPRRFTANGVSIAQSASPYGGRAYSTTDNSSNDGILFVPIVAATNIWTFSCLVKFNGASSNLGGSKFFVINNAFTLGIDINGATGFVQINSGATTWSNKAISAFNAWTRVTMATNGVNGRLFFNGAFDSTQTLNMSIDLVSIGLAFPYPMADFFWWTRTLTDSDVMTHAADPYGTTMRPRLSAMRLGPGRSRFPAAPPSIQIWDH